MVAARLRGRRATSGQPLGNRLTGTVRAIGTRISLCGTFEVELDGRRVEAELRGAQRRLLLAYLLLNRERPVSRDELQAALWEDGATRSRDALAPPLSRLRRVLGAARLVGVGELRLALGPDAWIDVEAARSAVAEARDGDATTASTRAGEAAAILARGLLPELQATWLDAERARLQGLHVEALELLARAGVALGDGHAVEAARAAVELAPFRESAWVALLEALTARGNAAEALRAFEEVRTLLRDELGTVPGPALLAAHRAVLAAEPPLPVSTVAAPSRSSAPSALTPLIGREREAATVAAQLRQDDVRLVTLLGAGGIGKTRLALEVAARLAPDYEAGVQFVDLTRIRDPHLLAPAIATELGLRASGRRPPLEELEGYLRSRRVLLVLDNFEHVADAAPVVSELLQSAPRVKALVTSRTVLRVRGEHQFVVTALPETQAIELFTERAVAVEPGFAPAGDDADAVRQICRRLDGVPLALELAATRVRLLPPRTLLARLDDRFNLLTDGARDAPERQRTLRDTIAWSYDLLADDERQLFRALGVFAGGFDLAATESVHGANALTALGALLDQSLVRLVAGSGEPRYALLESLREYALVELRACGAEPDIRMRHAEHYRSLAEQAGPALEGPEQLTWLARLEDEHDNLRAALRWFIDHDDLDGALAIGWGIWRLWWFNGHVDEGARWFHELVAASRDHDLRVRAQALSGAGLMTLATGDAATGAQMLEDSLPMLREARLDRSIAVTAGTLALILTRRGEHARATALVEESLALAGKLGLAWLTPTMRNFRAQILLRADERAQALADLEQALDAARLAGDRLALLMSFYNLALVADAPRAVGLLREGLELAAAIGDTGSVAYFLEGLATHTSAEHAAVLRGAAAGLLEDVGGAWLEFYAADRFPAGEETAAGRALDVPAAVVYALSAASKQP